MKSLLLSHISAGDCLPNLKLIITATTVVTGALASRDYSPLHHDVDYATTQAGHKDIFLNTPTQAGFFERFLTDWAGPMGRVGRMRFNMTQSVYPGDELLLTGEVSTIDIDEQGCGWAALSLHMKCAEKIVTQCTVKYALPVNESDNPWQRRGKNWQP